MRILPTRTPAKRKISKRLQAEREYWSEPAVMRREELLSNSRLPESKALPPLDNVVKRGKIERLRYGQVAVIGWQFAPESGADRLAKIIAKNAKKLVKRERYQRMMRRRQGYNHV